MDKIEEFVRLKGCTISDFVRESIKRRIQNQYNQEAQFTHISNQLSQLMEAVNEQRTTRMD